MGLFDNSRIESLFLNPVFLDYDYQPKLVPFRESQQHYIASCINPLFQNRNGKNLLIMGNPGVGKTVSLRNVLMELKEKTDDIFCVYVNCWKKESAFKIISEICNQVGYKWLQNKRTDDLMKEAVAIINEKSAVIILDEADKIEDQGIIYSLVEDVNRKCIFIITNNEGFLAELDSRIKSRLMPSLLEFKPYNLEQTRDILKERAKYAFVENSLEKEAFELIAEKCFELNDIRTGLFLMKEAGDIAELDNSNKILLKHAEKAISNIEIFQKRSVKVFEESDKSILDIIKENSGKTTAEIFEIYKNFGGNKSYRTFQRKIKDFETAGIISVEEVRTGGNYNVIRFGKVET